ncbi:MAG: DUF3833 domain-containing protein [Porticoccaceae bacterium]|nr:DUF3833 domain-containing protein [Porticoccaceae bacterium]
MDDLFYSQTHEPLQPEHYFLGQTFAWGIFEDSLGRLRRSFQVSIEGSMENGELVLDEQFLYNDGQREQRIWRIRPRSQGQYEGRADDVIGKARGKADQQQLRWCYEMNLAIGPRRVRVRFDDRMYLQPGGVLVNRARVCKLGIPLGTVTLFFRKDAGPAPAPAQQSGQQL